MLALLLLYVYSKDIEGEKNGGCRLPAALGQSDPLGRPASNLGMPEQRKAIFKLSKMHSNAG